jgi:hypothetical protein
LLPSDTPEASLCCLWQMLREEKDHSATWQHIAPHCSSVNGEDSEEWAEWLGNSSFYLPHRLDLARLDPPLFELIKDWIWGQHCMTS